MSSIEKTFAKTPKTDAILLVDGKKLHVNKALLSYHSDYFKALFESDFMEKSINEIKIEGVDFEDFAILLSLVLHDPLKVTEKNVQNLLELSDRFLIVGARNHVENWISYTKTILLEDKLLLATLFNLENLLVSLGF